MAYRRTDAIARRLAERQAAVLAAAQWLAAEEGMAGMQVARVAERAGLAAGTIYRYFPSKTDLIAAVIAAVSAADLEALRRAAAAAPGPLSALAAALTTVGARAVRHRRLTWAVLAEPLGSGGEPARGAYRTALVREFKSRIGAALAANMLPPQEPELAAAALVGALLEGLVGPGILAAGGPGCAEHAAVEALSLFLLRALGIPDPHARGLVMSTRAAGRPANGPSGPEPSSTTRSRG